MVRHQLRLHVHQYGRDLQVRLGHPQHPGGTQLERWWANSTLNRSASAFGRVPIRAVSVIATVILADLLLTVATGVPSPTAPRCVVFLVAALAGMRVRTSWDALARARTARLLAAALEPPEPPEQTHEASSSEDER